MPDPLQDTMDELKARFVFRDRKTAEEAGMQFLSIGYGYRGERSDAEDKALLQRMLGALDVFVMQDASERDIRPACLDNGGELYWAVQPELWQSGDITSVYCRVAIKAGEAPPFKSKYA